MDHAEIPFLLTLTDPFFELNSLLTVVIIKIQDLKVIIWNGLFLRIAF